MPRSGSYRRTPSTVSDFRPIDPSAQSGQYLPFGLDCVPEHGHAYLILVLLGSIVMQYKR
jgi:hypothetical protein